MRTTSGLRRVLAATVMGAAVAGGVVIAGGTPDSQGEPVTPTPTTGSSSAQAKPKPTPALPFNAKITSQDIPVKGGGVRSGGCSGSLIAPEWVITAGHCFHDVDDVRITGKPTNTVTVTVGKLKDADPGGHTAVVVDVRQSPVNDIALARLSTAVPDIVPLTLATTPPAVGQQLRFAGWGSLSSTVVAPSDHLKQGRFAVLVVKDTTLEADSVVPRTVENSPCPIDSGAPYFTTEDEHTGVLVAVESSGPPCPQPGREKISRVDVVADWIHQQIG